ncbi:MAG: hypothetical protein ABEL04_07275 [Salinibacter sp.]|uniref:hypothetical protein n=1 Tax=Salinibacter sp. TaxID=2065818 RepID=UPI0035D4A547
MFNFYGTSRVLGSEWAPTRPALAVLSAVALLFASCDPTVDVVRPSEQYQYSLFGALNVAADTQVIRVEPLGDTTQIGAPPEFDGTVMLKNLDGKAEVRLRDSFATVGEQDARVHNFWTTHSIRPSTTYRVSVQRNGDAVTKATTTTPARPPDLSYSPGLRLPCIFPGPFEIDPLKPPNTFVVRARNIEHIAVADAIYPVTYETEQETLRTRNDFSYYNTIERNGGIFEIFVFYRPELVRLNPDPPPGPSQECAGFEEFTHPYALVAVASGGPGWPEEWRGLPFDQIVSPDTFSNVRGGHGFVAGIYSDTIRVPLRRRNP